MPTIIRSGGIKRDQRLFNSSAYRTFYIGVLVFLLIILLWNNELKFSIKRALPGAVLLDFVLAFLNATERSLNDLLVVQTITELLPLMGNWQVLVKVLLCPVYKIMHFNSVTIAWIGSHIKKNPPTGCKLTGPCQGSSSYYYGSQALSILLKNLNLKQDVFAEHECQRGQQSPNWLFLCPPPPFEEGGGILLGKLNPTDLKLGTLININM